MSTSFEYIFKYIIVGDSGVGKSSIMLQFTDKRFKQVHDMTIGVEFGSKILEIDKRLFKIQIWDTAGQEAFKSITRAYYREAAAVLLVYDVSNQKSFDAIDSWLQDIHLMTNDPQIILIGNKSDLAKRQVSYEQGKNYADQHNMLFIETSAKNRVNIDETFTSVAHNIVKKLDIKAINIHDTSRGVRMGIPGRGSGIKIVKVDYPPDSSRCC